MPKRFAQDTATPNWPHSHRIEEGRLLYHGTEISFPGRKIRMPTWFTRSKAIAQWFALRFGATPQGSSRQERGRQNAQNSQDSQGSQNAWDRGEKIPRILVFKTTEDIALPEIKGKKELTRFGERVHVDVRGSEAMRETIRRSTAPGWVIPNNYQNGGDDILLCSRDKIQYIEEEIVSE